MKYKGTWSDVLKYTKYNVVQYVVDGAKQNYMAISSDIPIGTNPTNNNYFIPITLRGEQGVSGSGMSPRGVWDETLRYNIFDCVVFNNKLWYAISDNINEIPSETSSSWGVLMKLHNQIVVSSTEPTNQDINDFWFHLQGTEFTIKQKQNDGYLTIKIKDIDKKITQEDLTAHDTNINAHNFLQNEISNLENYIGGVNQSANNAYSLAGTANTTANNAYSLAGTANTAANTAQTTANNANANADNRVSKSGDTINGNLTVNGTISGYAVWGAVWN